MSIWIHESLKGCSAHCASVEKPYLSTLLRRCLALAELGIQPIIVMDGPHYPSAKKRLPVGFSAEFSAFMLFNYQVAEALLERLFCSAFPYLMLALIHASLPFSAQWDGQGAWGITHPLSGFHFILPDRTPKFLRPSWEESLKHTQSHRCWKQMSEDDDSSKIKSYFQGFRVSTAQTNQWVGQKVVSGWVRSERHRPKWTTNVCLYAPTLFSQ